MAVTIRYPHPVTGQDVFEAVPSAPPSFRRATVNLTAYWEHEPNDIPPVRYVEYERVAGDEQPIRYRRVA